MPIKCPVSVCASLSRPLPSALHLVFVCRARCSRVGWGGVCRAGWGLSREPQSAAVGRLSGVCVPGSSLVPNPLGYPRLPLTAFVVCLSSRAPLQPYPREPLPLCPGPLCCAAILSLAGLFRASRVWGFFECARFGGFGLCSKAGSARQSGPSARGGFSEAARSECGVACPSSLSGPTFGAG